MRRLFGFTISRTVSPPSATFLATRGALERADPIIKSFSSLFQFRSNRFEERATSWRRDTARGSSKRKAVRRRVGTARSTVEALRQYIARRRPLRRYILWVGGLGGIFPLTGRCLKEYIGRESSQILPPPAMPWQASFRQPLVKAVHRFSN